MVVDSLRPLAWKDMALQLCCESHGNMTGRKACNVHGLDLGPVAMWAVAGDFHGVVLSKTGAVGANSLQGAGIRTGAERVTCRYDDR